MRIDSLCCLMIMVKSALSFWNKQTISSQPHSHPFCFVFFVFSEQLDQLPNPSLTAPFPAWWHNQTFFPWWYLTCFPWSQQPVWTSQLGTSKSTSQLLFLALTLTWPQMRSPRCKRAVWLFFPQNSVSLQMFVIRSQGLIKPCPLSQATAHWVW